VNGIGLEISLKSYINKRNILFFVLTGLAILMAYAPLKDLLANAERSEYYSHILLIPLVSAFFFCTGRKKIFSDVKYSYTAGIPLLVVGGLLYVFGGSKLHDLNQNDYTSLITFSAVLFWTGAFVLLYGTNAFREAMFPILFLVFMIPIPSVLMEKSISALLAGSTLSTDILFKLTGIPHLKEGYVFHLPRISIEVAKECSGIRSSLGLFITAVLAGHLFLKTFQKKVVLALLVFPITVLKNGFRIVTLSSLAVYVDEKFLTQSFLHHSGGFLFYIPALLLLGVVVWWLRKLEQRKGNNIEPEG